MDGGHRGKCYTNYITRQENRPAMGFSVDTPCLFIFQMQVIRLEHFIMI